MALWHDTGMTPFPRSALAACAALVLASASQAASPGVSEWSSGLHASVRLVDGGPGAEGTRKAGIEIRLDPHFKTYWRTPGDSGLPPSFDWSASDNVKSVDVLWPAPERFQDPAGFSLGYKGQVVLPLRVTTTEHGKPATLLLKLDYAVCEQICIPVHGEAALPLGGPLAPFADLVAEAEKRVPTPAAMGEGAPPVLAAVRQDGDALRVTAALEPGAPTDLFVEGDNADWVFGAPAVLSDQTAGGVRRVEMRIPVDSRPPDAKLAGQALTLTLKNGDKAVEVRTRLDAEVKPH